MYRSLPTLPKNRNSKVTNPMIAKTIGRRADRTSQTVSTEILQDPCFPEERAPPSPSIYNAPRADISDKTSSVGDNMQFHALI